LELALEVAVFLLRHMTDCRHCCLHLCSRETILPCDGGPFMGGGRAPEPNWAGATRRTGAVDLFWSFSAREEPRGAPSGVSTAGKKVERDGFGRSGHAHRSYATSKGKWDRNAKRRNAHAP